jgi:hypothetical protein
MAWPWNKNRDGGGTGGGGSAAEEEKKEMDAFIEKIGVSLEAKLEEKLKPVREKVEGIEKKWTTLEESAATEEAKGKEIDETTLTEEQKRQLNERKLLALSIATNARITEGEVLAECNSRFPEFVPKVREYFANTPLERKGAADYATYCRNIVKMVVGDAALAGGLRYDTNSKSFFLEDASASKGTEGMEFLAPDMTWTDPISGKTLTGRQQLAKLGIAPEDFAKSVKEGIV